MMDDKFLSQDEIDALLEGVTGDTDESSIPKPDPSAVKKYDLATQERIIRGRLPSLEIINDRFARLFRLGLYNFLPRSIEITSGPVQTTKYSEFLRRIIVPANLNIIKINPLPSTALVVMDPYLVFMLVDNFFGGDGRFQTRIEGREFTGTELRIIQRVLSVALDALTKAWEFLYPVEFEYIRSEMNNQFANIVSANETVVSSSFRISIGSNSGDLHICMPFSMLEPIHHLLRSNSHSESVNQDQRWTRLLKQQIQDAEMDCVANLCTIDTSLRQVMNLQQGDLIWFDMPKSIELKIEGVPILDCQFGKLNGQYALQINQFIQHPDHASQEVIDE